MFTPAQIEGLNAAYTRKQQGKANASDLANLNYATGKGWNYQAPAAPAAPAVPATQPAAPADPNNNLATQFGTSGISLPDALKVFQDQNQVTGDERNKIYSDLGINDLTSKLFELPTQSTADLYNAKYSELGLDRLKQQISQLNDTINQKRNDLNSALGKVNENPWLDEASRLGRSRNLQNLAEGDINNYINQANSLQNLYGTGISDLHNFITNYSNDFNTNQQLNTNKLNYLLSQAEQQLTALQNQKNASVYRYITPYLQGAEGAKKQATADELAKAGYRYISTPAERDKIIKNGGQVTTINGRTYEIPAKTEIIDAGGQKQLINSQTGQVIKNLGSTKVPTATEQLNAALQGYKYDSAGNLVPASVGGFDISSYATDPNHENSVQSILNNIGQFNTLDEVQNYINKVAPGSPITAQMISSSSAKYGVPWEMLVAMMQQDSSLGTKGKGAKTMNPGNVGNTDSGKTTKMTSWQAGVDAVGNWLSNHRAPETTTDSDIMAEGLVKGDIYPSQLTKRTKDYNNIVAKATKQGYSLAKASLQETAAKKYIQGMNSTQMIRYQGLAGSVVNTIDEVKELADKMKNVGITGYNKAKLEVLVNTAGNTESGQLASAYLTAVNTLKEEFANLANGGYAPTDAAWDLANKQISANFGVDQLKTSLTEVQRLINYRTNAINSVGVNLGSLGNSNNSPSLTDEQAYQEYLSIVNQ